jgi:hypothetical protein
MFVNRTRPGSLRLRTISLCRSIVLSALSRNSLEIPTIRSDNCHFREKPVLPLDDRTVGEFARKAMVDIWHLRIRAGRELRRSNRSAFVKAGRASRKSNLVHQHDRQELGTTC